VTAILENCTIRKIWFRGVAAVWINLGLLHDASTNRRHHIWFGAPFWKLNEFSLIVFWDTAGNSRLRFAAFIFKTDKYFPDLMPCDSLQSKPIYKSVRCSFDILKRLFFTLFNSNFSKIGRFAPAEEVVINLLRSKCIPILLYGVEARPFLYAINIRLTFLLLAFVWNFFELVQQSLLLSVRNYSIFCLWDGAVDSRLATCDLRLESRFGYLRLDSSINPCMTRTWLGTRTLWLETRRKWLVESVLYWSLL